MISKEYRMVFYVNLILVVLEIIAFIHDVYAFKLGLFEWYTVDSNVLQLIISGFVVYYCVKEKPLPGLLTVAHFISAVGLTVTFLIAAFVLAPEGGIAYFFLKVYEQSAGLIATWFAIIAALCLGLAFLYYKVKWRKAL